MKTRIAEPLTPAGSKIVQRRIQMLVHSYLYYALDNPIVSDATWQRWANELAIMQRNHPNLVLHFYDDDFKDWDGSTGYHLPQYPWVVDRGQHLLHLHERPHLRSELRAELKSDTNDVSVRIERTMRLQMAEAHEAGRVAAIAGRERRPPGYRKRIELDAWHEGYDQALAPPAPPAPPPAPAAGQLALF